MTQHSIETMVEINVPVRKTSLNEQPSTPIPTPDTIRMLSIKQEPVEWTEFEHDNNLMEKSSIEVNVKPELVYSKDSSEGEGAAPVTSVHIKAHSLKLIFFLCRGRRAGTNLFTVDM